MSSGASSGTQHPRDRPEVLTGEHLGRRDQRRLTAALRRPGASRAARRASCPSRPRPARAGSSASRPRRSRAIWSPTDDLVGSARERQRRVEAARGAHPARGASPTARGRTAAAGGARPAARTPRACAACCAPARSAPRSRGDGCARSRCARRAVRAARRRSSGSGSATGPSPSSTRSMIFVQLPARDRARGGIDRDRQVRVRLRGQPRGLLVVEQLVVGMGELLRAAVLPHLSGEDAAAPGLQVLHAPRLVEERERQLALPVADDDLEQRPLAVLHAALVGAPHLGDDRDRLAERAATRWASARRGARSGAGSARAGRRRCACRTPCSSADAVLPPTAPSRRDSRAKADMLRV